MLRNLSAEQARYEYTDADVARILGISRSSYSEKKKTGRFTMLECKKLCQAFTAHLSICFQTRFLKRQRKGVRFMEIIIKGDPKEIAALVLAVQGQQISVDEIMKQITDQIASELSSVHIL